MGESCEDIWHPFAMKIVTLVRILREVTNYYLLEVYGNHINCHVTFIHASYMKVLITGKILAIGVALLAWKMGFLGLSGHNFVILGPFNFNMFA